MLVCPRPRVGSCAFTRANGWLRSDQTVTRSRARTPRVVGTRVHYPRHRVWEFSTGFANAIACVCCASTACSPMGLIAKTGGVGRRAHRDLYHVAINRAYASSMLIIGDIPTIFDRIYKSIINKDAEHIISLRNINIKKFFIVLIKKYFIIS